MVIAASSIIAPAAAAETGGRPPPVRLAVMGDSNSHSYQDRYSFPLGSMWRGGPEWQRVTLQWTEVLARLRGDQVDPGPWGVWGERGRVAQLRDWVGLPSRSPRKEDYRYNFAASGAGCDDLMTGRFRQAPRLAALVREERDAWRGGIVVLRIGIIDVGSVESLQAMSVDPAAPDLRRRAEGCVARVRAAIDLLRAAQPSLRFVVVGVFNDAHDPFNADRWRSASALANIEAGLALLNDPLRQMAEADPSIRYFDDNAWFRRLWGSRDAQGRPAYRPVVVGGRLSVVNAIGDAPENAVLQDDHAGLVWNALWAQAFVDLLDAPGSIRVARISDAELAEFVLRQIAAR